MSEVYDPRQDIPHDITAGQVYEDDRDDVTYRLVYADEHYALLRSDTSRRRTDTPMYRGEYRDTFEEYVGGGRFELVEEAEDPPRMPDGLTPVLACVNRLKDHYLLEGGRKNQHKAEALAELLEELEGLDAREMDWERAEGVGPQTAANLEEAGYTTDVALRQADDAALLDVGGVGQKNLQNLRELAGGDGE